MKPETTVARKAIEERYGPIGSGAKILFLKGVPVGLASVSRKLMMSFADLVPIDGGTLGGGSHWVRYYDGEQRKVIVIEFDEELDLVRESGADIMDWIGEEYFRIHWRIFCPAGGEEWLGADAAKGGGSGR